MLPFNQAIWIIPVPQPETGHGHHHRRVSPPPKQGDPNHKFSGSLTTLWYSPISLRTGFRRIVVALEPWHRAHRPAHPPPELLRAVHADILRFLSGLPEANFNSPRANTRAERRDCIPKTCVSRRATNQIQNEGKHGVNYHRITITTVRSIQEISLDPSLKEGTGVSPEPIDETKVAGLGYRASTC